MTRTVLRRVLQCVVLCAPLAFSVGIAPLGARADDGRSGWLAPRPQDKTKDKTKDAKDKEAAKKAKEAKEAARKALEKELDAIAADFKASSTTGLLARVAKNGSLGLKLGKSRGAFKRKQAKGVLDTWFKKKTLLSVKRKKVTGSTGQFTLKFRNQKKKDVDRERSLLITVEKSKGTFRLTQITVE